MKSITKFYENLISSKMGVIASRPASGQVPILTDIIIKYGVEEKKKITIYSIDDDVENFFTVNILAALMDVPKISLRKHICPLKFRYLELDNTILHENYFNNLEKLASSPIEVIHYKSDRLIDLIDAITDEESGDPSDIIIIYALETFFKNSESPRQLLKTLKNLNPNTSVIMTCGIDHEVEETSVYNFEDIHNYQEIKVFTDAIALFQLEEFTPESKIYKTKVRFKDSEFSFTFDRDTNKLGE